MSFESACAAAFFRSVFVAVLGWNLALAAAGAVHAARGWRRTALWCALWLPFVTPGMFVGYAYNGWTLFLSAAEFWKSAPWNLLEPLRLHLTRHDGIWNESLLCLMLTARVVPVGAALACFGPAPTLSPAAEHARRLALWNERSLARRIFVELGLRLHGRWQQAAPATGLMFLLAFQEFELVARLARPSWTVWLIDAQATGVTLEKSMWLGMLPAVGQVVLLLPVLLVFRGRRKTSALPRSPQESGGTSRILLTAFLLASLGTVCAVPAVLVGSAFPAGAAAVWTQTTTRNNLAREIAVGLLVSGLATAAAIGIVRWKLDRNHLETPRSRFANRVGWLIAVIPGLLGPLPCSLLILSLLRILGIGSLSRSVVPWLIGQTLMLLPRAVFLDLLVRHSTDSTAAHAARLLTANGSGIHRKRVGRDLLWKLSGVKAFAAGWLMWYGAYLDLATGQMLAPPGMASAPVTLYIQMHYGRNAILSAMTVVTVLAPVLTAGGCLLLRSIVARSGKS